MYWLVRIAFLRSFFFIFSVAFLVALRQNEALIGDQGLTPAAKFWDVTIRKRFGSASLLSNFVKYPSLFWWIKVSTSSLNMTATLGLAVSIFITASGGANIFLVLIAWLCQMSIQSVGQVWYGFGWENQLLETCFLTLFLVPFWSVSPLPSKTPVPYLCICGFRWLLFRIMIGAGLIKIRGDSCWRDLTAMNYHYETQPVPNFLSAFFHYAPEFWHKFETASNHVIELLCPFLLFAPTALSSEWTRMASLLGGVIQIVFQLVLICSGNLSFLNWLTAVPALFSFDDRFLASMGIFSIETIKRAEEAEAEAAASSSASLSMSAAWWWDPYLLTRRIMQLAAFLLLAYLSVPVVDNLLSSRQLMNAAFSPFKVLNTYGAFGSISRERHEVVVMGTMENVLSPVGRAATAGAVSTPKWEEYSFKVKPGNVNSFSKWISPYHYRLDWLLWFAALYKSYEHTPWLVHLVFKLLNNDDLATRYLLAADGGNPFKDKSPPRFVKVDLYLYQMENPFGQGKELKKLDGDWERGKVWRRKYVKNFLPPMDLENPTLKRFLIERGMIDQ